MNDGIGGVAASKRFAVYARFSTALQNPRSIDDQVRVCRERAAALGVEVAAVYGDAGASGATTAGRPQLELMLAHARRGRFDGVLAEALDRVSRSQADTALLYRELEFLGVALHTVEEGEIGAIHVGLKGAMNEMFLDSLRQKIRRGLAGKVLRGLATVRVSYGYRKANVIGPDGEVVKGLREIVPEQAEVVRRIFRDYAAGKTARRIALELNAEGVPAPQGEAWVSNSLSGGAGGGRGILNNDMYRGMLVFGRTRATRNPKTGRRVRQPRPRSEWITCEVPHLRIVDDELWGAVRRRVVAGTAGRVRTHGAPLPLTGVLRCAECGGKMVIRGGRVSRYACGRMLRQGLCGMRGGGRSADLELRTAEALRTAVGGEDLALLAARAGDAARRRRDALEAGVAERRRGIDRLLDAVQQGAALPSLEERLVALEREVAAMTIELEDAFAPPETTEGSGGVAGRIRRIADEIADAVRNGSGEERRKALLRMRPMIESVRVRTGRRPGRFDIEEVRLREEAVVAAAFEPAAGEGLGTAA